jgi:hypothetical protein
MRRAVDSAAPMDCAPEAGVSPQALGQPLGEPGACPHSPQPRRLISLLGQVRIKPHPSARPARERNAVAEGGPDRADLQWTLGPVCTEMSARTVALNNGRFTGSVWPLDRRSDWPPLDTTPSPHFGQARFSRRIRRTLKLAGTYSRTSLASPAAVAAILVDVTQISHQRPQFRPRRFPMINRPRPRMTTTPSARMKGTVER